MLLGIPYILFVVAGNRAVCGQNNVFNRLATLGKTDKKGEEKRGEEETSLAGWHSWLAPLLLQLWHSRSVERTDVARSVGRSSSDGTLCATEGAFTAGDSAAVVMHAAPRMHHACMHAFGVIRLFGVGPTNNALPRSLRTRRTPPQAAIEYRGSNRTIYNNAEWLNGWSVLRPLLPAPLPSCR